MDRKLHPGLERFWIADRLRVQLEVQLLTSPLAALHWRSQVGLVEAVRSIELNGHVLDPSALLYVLMQKQTAPSHSDAGAVQLAESIWQALTTALDREEYFVRSATVSVSGGSPVDTERGSLDSVRLSEMVSALEKLELSDGRGHDLLRLITVPKIVRKIYGEPSPIAERLWMMAADQRGRHQYPKLPTHPEPGRIYSNLLLNQPRHAEWVVAPASVFCVHGPEVWNPDSPDFAGLFIQNAEVWLSQQLDDFITIARWGKNDLTKFAHSGRNGARVKIAQLIANTPILNVNLVARVLGVHERTAVRLLNEAAEAAVIIEITGRYRYRVWASPSLAKLLQSKSWDQRPEIPKPTATALPTEIEFSQPKPLEPPDLAGSKTDYAGNDARLQAMLNDLDALSEAVLDI